MKIFAPVKNATGTYASVRFVNGVGETDNPHLIKWFKEHGFKVESPKVTLDDESTLDIALETVEEISQPDFEAMTPNELRDWMREIGYGSKIKNTRNKEKLLEILRG